ncbi:hypothetical protein FQN54_005212 [Arachnomyces sp. PD_36]|nr:hypothetical protein FQN54_005212 [Arachnomyces sp. PD_36]
MAYRRPSHSGSLPGDSSASANPAIAYPFSNNSNTAPMPRRGPIEGPYGKLTRRVTWRSTTYKLAAYLWVLGVLYLCWLIRPLFYIPFSSNLPDKVPVLSSVNDDYFANFYGREECGISSLDLYKPPVIAGTDKLQRNPYCQDRNSLLEAMSLGDRFDFDSPFTSSGCNHRWYSAAEICVILERFDHVLFAGDESLANIYAAFNMLLSEDMAHGALKQWEMTKEQLAQCSCDKQYLTPDCAGFLIHSSEDVYAQGANGRSRYPYACKARVSHSFIPTASPTAPEKSFETFKSLLSSSESRRSKHIPVILGPSSSPQEALTETWGEWTSSALASGNKTPFLWVGPTAASQKSSGFGTTQEMGKTQDTLLSAAAAQNRGVEVLGMYNATLKASSSDGYSYGERVSLVQAMMLINWLSRL